MYLIEWFCKETESVKKKKVQYLPDIQEVVRQAFGNDRPEFLTITRED